MANKEKHYTAQEMRITAEYMHSDYTFALIPVSYKHAIYRQVSSCEVQAMLRQAADSLEREESAEVVYGYGVVLAADCSVIRCIDRKHAEDMVEYYGKSKATLVRRAIGEWEEVNDGE